MRTWASLSSLLSAVGLLLAACGTLPSVGSVAAIIPVGAAPAAGLAAESSAVWVPSDLDGSISRVDPATNSVSAKIQPGDARSCSLCLGAVAMQSGSVWVTSSSARLALVGIDRRSNRVSSSAPLPVFPSAVIADEDGSLWLASVLDSTVVRFNPASQQIVARMRVPRPSRLAAGDGAIWVIARPDEMGEGLIVRIDPRTNMIAASVEVGLQPTAIAYGEGGVWVIDEASQRLQRIDPNANAVVASVPTGFLPSGVAAGEGSIWVISQSAAGVNGPALSRIDPSNNAVLGSLAVGPGVPVGLAVGAGSVWVATRNPDTIVRVQPVGAPGGSHESVWLLPAVLAAALIVVVWLWPKAARAAGWTSRRRGDQLEALRRFSETRQTTRSA